MFTLVRDSEQVAAPAPMASLQLPSLAASAGLCLLSVLAAALLAVTLYILGVVASFAVFCLREFARSDPDRPPLIGTVFRQLRNFDRLFDEHVEYALTHRTSRLIYPGHSEFSTSDPAVIEHVLKTSFSKYSRVFSMPIDHFRPPFLRSLKSLSQDLLMKTTMDSIFKVGFGFELNTLSGSDESSIRFANAFDEANSLVYHRYVDLFWQLRDIVLNFLIAGKDTTGNTLTWFFYMLCKNPIVQHKVAIEINEYVELAEEDKTIEDFTARLNEGAIEKMHYLHAAISETLRLYPAVPVVQINSL